MNFHNEHICYTSTHIKKQMVSRGPSHILLVVITHPQGDHSAASNSAD